MYRLRYRDEFKTWLRRLEPKARARVLIRLNRMEDGNLGDVKSLGRGLSEARITFGPGYRLYFTRKGTEIVLLLWGGDKGGQQRDIARARLMLDEENG
jgi:putative addiction module killer protein